MKDMISENGKLKQEIKSSAQGSHQRPQDQVTGQCVQQTAPVEKIVIVEKIENQGCPEHEGDEIAVMCKHCTRQKPRINVFTSKSTKISELENAIKSMVKGNGVVVKDNDTLAKLGFKDGENCVIVISGLSGVKVKVEYELNEVVEENKMMERKELRSNEKEIKQVDKEIEEVEVQTEDEHKQGERSEETKEVGSKLEIGDWGLTEKLFEEKRSLDKAGELYRSFITLIRKDPVKGGIQFIERSATDLCKFFGELITTLSPLQLKDPFYTRYPLLAIKKRVKTSRLLDWKFIHKPDARLTATLMEHEDSQSFLGVTALVVGINIPALLFAVQLALCGANVDLISMENDTSLSIISLLPELFEVLSLFGVVDMLPYLQSGNKEGQAANPVARCVVLQHALLRAAFLLGCKVYPNFEFLAIGGNGKVQLKARSGAALKNIDGRRLSNKLFDIICDSTGVVRDSRFNGQPVIGRKSKTLSRFYNGVLCRLEGVKDSEEFALRSVANPEEAHYFKDKEISLTHISHLRSPFGGWMSAICKGDLRSQIPKKVDLFCDENLTSVQDNLNKMVSKIKNEWQIDGDVEEIERFSFKDVFKPKTFLRSIATRGRQRTLVVLIGDAAMSSFWQIGNSSNHGCMSAMVVGEAIKDLIPKLKDNPRKAEEYIKTASQQLSAKMKELEHGKLGGVIHRRRPI